MADPDTSANPFHTLAMSRWSTADTAENPMRVEGEKDLEFLNLQQWDKADADARQVALVIDQIGEPYRQLVGQFRRAHPGIQLSPVDSGADIETAERYQGAIRHVEATGGAKAAREEAFKGCVGPGWGYYRLFTEFEYSQEGRIPDDPQAIFDQCIKYQAIENQFTVWRDPSTPLHEPWKCRFAFQVEDIPLDEFKAKWPDAIATQADAFMSTGIATPDWFPEGSVRVADYFYIEESDGDEYLLLPDGRSVLLKDAPDGVTPLQRQTTKIRKVMLAKITGAEILEGNDEKTAGREQPWPFIPIVPMFGEALTVKGKRTVRGIVRATRDPQRSFNYHASELVYELAIAPKSKVMMAEGQDEGYEEMWKRAPSEAFPALKYKPVSLMGQPVGPPVVAQFTDPNKIQALVVAMEQDKSNCRTTTGWYDSTDPNRANSEQSGKAVLARKEQQMEGSVNYMESASQAIRFETMLLLGAIPKLFNRPGRAIRIAGLENEDDSTIMTIGQPVKKADGTSDYFKFNVGRFDIRVDIGASYGTRRQEASTFQLELMKVLPETMAAAMAPIAVRNMDGPGNREIADRLDRTLPPNITGDDKDAQDDPAAMAQQLQQAEMKMQEMGQVIQGLQEAVKTDQVKAEADIQKAQLTTSADAQKAEQQDQVKLTIAQLEIESKERIEAAKLAMERELALMKIQADIEKAQIAAQAAQQRRVTKTITRGPNGEATGMEEIHEGESYHG